jgi:hypothetical protein
MSEHLQPFLDVLAAALGRGVSLDDPRGELLGYSAQDAGADAPRISAILSRRTPREVQRWQNEHGISVAVQPVRIPPNPALAMTGRICVPIRARSGALLAHLWVLEDGSLLNEDEMATAARAAVDIADVLRRDDRLRDADGMRQLDRWLHELLNPAGSAAVAHGDLPAAAAGTTDAVANDMLGAAPALRTSLAWIMVVRPRPQHAPPRVGRNALADALNHLRSADGQVASYRTEDEAVALYIGQPPAEVDLAAGLRALLRHRDGDRGRVLAGASDPGPFTAQSARSAHTQAATAARLAAVDPALPAFCPWRRLGLYRALLHTHTQELSALQPLLDHESSGASLLRTLETYLDLAGDAGAASAALNVHRTTLYYRLHRIADILQVDLSDGMTRTFLHTLLKRRRLANA